MLYPPSILRSILWVTVSMLVVGCGPSATETPTNSVDRVDGADRADGADSEGSGHSSSEAQATGTATGQSSDRAEPAAASTADDSPNFRLGDLLDPFEPPSLAELDGRVRWVERPVVDFLERLRAEQAQEKPLGSVEQALSARNDNPQANDLICSVLGRAPQANDTIAADGSFVRHTTVDLKTTNPLMMSASIEQEVASLTGFGLFSFDRKFEPMADADTVVSWHSSDDRMYEKVVMRKDLTWSDGKPITAHDIEFSFRVIMSKAVPVPAVRSGTEQLKLVKAYDDHTLVYFHKEGLATNDWNINFPVIPKHIYEKSIQDDPKLQVSDYHVKLENEPVVGGAYRIVERTRAKEILLEARPEYYTFEGKQVRRPPHFKQVRFRIISESSVALLAMKRGDLDEMLLQPEQWQTQTGDDDFYQKCTKAYGTEWVEFHFVWNCSTPFFSDKRVRQAMSYAFDHQEMLKTLLYGLFEPCNGIYNRDSPWSPPDAAPPYQQDLEKAEALLEQAGWTDSDGDGTLDKEINGKRVPFRFTILTPDVAERISICNLLRESLDQIGVVCDVRPIEFTVLMERTNTHAFEAAFGGWGTGTDPDTGDNIWKTNADRNFGLYSNPEVDRLYEQGKREFDLEKRRAIYFQIHRLLYEDQPYTWLYFRNSYYAFNKSVRGYVFSPRGPFSYGPGFGSVWKPAVQP